MDSAVVNRVSWLFSSCWERTCMAYWFMRMKQGSNGEDFAPELWGAGKIGVMFGTWRIHHVLDPHGNIDVAKLTATALSRTTPQPFARFDDRFLAPARKFLTEM